MVHPSAAARATSLSKLRLLSPASIRWICRGHQPSSAASASCVTPRCVRNSTTRSPKRRFACRVALWDNPRKYRPNAPCQTRRHGARFQLAVSTLRVYCVKSRFTSGMRVVEQAFRHGWPARRDERCGDETGTRARATFFEPFGATRRTLDGGRLRSAARTAMAGGSFACARELCYGAARGSARVPLRHQRRGSRRLRWGSEQARA
jgi:hypothetical protein